MNSAIWDRMIGYQDWELFLQAVAGLRKPIAAPRDFLGTAILVVICNK